eukprot:CAMPEP_0172554490 /NCGR_PEP_ID=MMETSP1067-20121228/54831_1 /TAXON_ID=265564 ORGANISM="Thalassiosira punctigera, Strain Tpunct2005C2" /NCGR_SAMPLE_ID=MMETSP1067 /ASSEMBLY_ACC=CAM_ASM_000444 /LENGTH=237 /DNA_ID=CAMNT_0013342869 /DNA_START=50 /DNA_END=759 /DNA_ORIENTATION=+
MMQQHRAMNSRTLLCTILFFVVDNSLSLTSLTSLRPNLGRFIIRSASQNQPPHADFAYAIGRSRRRRSKTSLHVSSSIASATGEADRAFRLGIQLEKAGLARAASAAFHEAATLYQCFLDHSTLAAGADVAGDEVTSIGDIGSTPANIFQHVTSLLASDDDDDDAAHASSPSVLAVLAYACIRLAHLSQDAFGDPRAAKRLYKLAASIDPYPSGAAYHGIGTSVEASIAHCFGQRGG